jgi:hypothetical protein
MKKRKSGKRRRSRQGKTAGAAPVSGGERPTGVEIDRLVERYVRLKRDMVGWAQGRFTDTIVEEAERLSSDGIISDSEIVRATEEIIHRPEAIDAFLAARPALRGPNRALARGFRDGFTGVFCPRARDGRLLELHNLVDDLDYLAAMSSDDPEAWQQLGEAACFISHVVPIGPLWTLSGAQRLLPPDLRLAHGLAAKLAQDRPSHFFRNPEYLARGWEAMEKQHEAFLARFGSAWVVGPPREVERLHGEMVAEKTDFETLAPELRETARTTQQRFAHLDLPRETMEAETLGMISHPTEGLMFCVEFARFRAAFEDPELGRDPDHREVVLGYLESDSIPPAVIETLASVDPARASVLFAAVLERPGFDWIRDGEALLRRYKPGFFERPALPSILPLPDAMVEGLLALEQQSGGGPG